MINKVRYKTETITVIVIMIIIVIARITKLLECKESL